MVHREYREYGEHEEYQEYTENVHADRPFTWSMAGLSLAFAIGGAWMLLGAGENGGGLSMLAAGALIGGLWRLFAVLYVRVEDGQVKAKYGPFGLSLPVAEIESARAEAYRWGSYGGWGIRWGLDQGKRGRALSQVFLRSGIILEMKNGSRHYITSRHPEDLAAAVNRMLLAPSAPDTAIGDDPVEI